MSTNYKFQGWLGHDTNAVGNMTWGEYEPKPFEEEDVDIEISHCGICGSDLHTLRSGWKPTLYPCVVGHEIVGKVVRAGNKVEGGIKVGDRIGVGAQSESCLKPECPQCSDNKENYCQEHNAQTFDSKFKDGSKTYGGYADYSRVPSHFAVKIPDKIPSAEAAPMLCGGVTVYSPLKRNGCGPGKKVGIIGIGGLGHFGILYAKALGADKIVAISRSSLKKSDALKLGADDFVATSEEKGWETQNAGSLDLIISTVSSHNVPLQEYLMLLGVGGQFIQVGAPEEDLPSFSAFALIAKNARVCGSSTGSPQEIREMLELSAEKGVHPWIEERPLKDANKALKDLEANKVRYRFTLVNEAHAK